MAKKNSLTAEDMKAKQKKFQNIAENLEISLAEEFLKDNFLLYAWSVILDRALSDTTGLKPVQRRILYTMYKAGLSPTANRSKVATLAGKVLEYHPHGDASVSDALKNMARDHVFRVPLIDGKGDFGAPGTPGAAGRYIEARMNQAAWLNVEELSENAVSMMENYDSTTVEPVKMPVKWPISIINGGSGMAVGYASNMPSHNPTEIMKAAKLLLKKPESTHASLQKIVQGPDFNMGGLITSHDGVKQYLETGSGSFKVRGQYEVTQGARNTSRIEFYEIPFGTNPEKIILGIQEAVEKKGLFKELSSYKDLSDLKHPIRLVIETKPSVNAKKVVQDLFKHTNLESNFSANITTIVDNKPKRSSLKELLLDFIEFRKLCVINKKQYSLAKKEARIHLINGLVKTLLDIDKAIAIIRKSDTTAEASAGLQKKFSIDEKQAEYVLSLQLRRLTRMDSAEIEQEKKNLEAEIEDIKALLNDEDVLKDYLDKEFNATLKVIGDERKTEINNLTSEELAEEEKAITEQLKDADKNMPCYITRFTNGRVMRSAEPFVYNMGRLKKLAHTPIVEQFKMMTHDSIVFVDNQGNGHKTMVSYLPEGKACKPSDAGVSIPKGSHIVGVAKYESGKDDVGLAIGTKLGSVKVAKTDFPKSGEEFPVITLAEGDEVVSARWMSGPAENTHFIFVSEGGNALVFDASTVRASGHKAGGVRGMKLKSDNDKVIHFGWIDLKKNPHLVLTTYSGKTLKATMLSEIPPKGKGGMGVATQSFKKGENVLKTAFAGDNTVLAADGVVQTIVSSPPVNKRTQSGSDFTIDVIMGASEIA